MAPNSTLRTAIHIGASPAELADLVFTAATDRFYASTGHLVDFANKAFELLDLIGWEHAEEVLPALVDQLVTSRGGEEQNAWRHPHDLVPALRAVEDELPQSLETGRDKSWDKVLQLSETLLGDDPLQIIEALEASDLGRRTSRSAFSR